MRKLEGAKQVRQLLIDCGINNDHIYKIYNDKRKVGRRYKIILSVFRGGITGELPLTDDIVKKLSSSLKLYDAEDVSISQREIRFKIK